MTRFAPGESLGPYRLVAVIGEGGMGEVYRARDTRLGREVAIKVLHERFASDAEYAGRFEREARAVAALSHPAIVALYDVGHVGGSLFTVAELLEGESLGALLAKGPIPFRRAAEIGARVAEGLAAAHDRGFVHRDLKPDNVFLTKDGRVKILDFGLALAPPTFETAGEPHLSPRTKAGLIVGTVGYMAPEQVRGEAADGRADLFAFGALLYEMVTGRRAFERSTAVGTMSAILDAEPPDPPAEAAVPEALLRIVRRCLEKNVEARFQSARDLAFALEAFTLPSRSSEPGLAPDPRPAGERRRTARLAAGFALAFAAGVLAALLAAGRRTDGAARTEPLRSHLLTDLASVERGAALSPDGASLAFVRGTRGNADIWLLRVGGRNALDLTKDSPANEGEPAFSPDGSLIAFRSERDGGGVFLMGATGESVRRLTDFGYAPAFSPDGRSVAVATESVRDPRFRDLTSELWLVALPAGTRTKLFSGDGVQPSFSPSGRRIVFWGLRKGSGRRDLFTIPASGLVAPGAEPVALTDDDAVDWAPTWGADGTVLFLSDRGGSMNLWSLRVDESTGRPLSAPEPLSLPAAEVAGISRSQDGSRLAWLALQAKRTLELHPFDARAGRPSGALTPLLSTSRRIHQVAAAPDGSWAVVRTGGEAEDLVVVSRDGSARWLTDDAARERAPAVFPDGRRIAFHSDRSGAYAVWTIGLDGSGLTRLSIPLEGALTFPRVSPDARALTVVREEESFFVRLGADGQPSTAEKLPAPSAGTWFLPRAFSPDGSRLVGDLTAASAAAGIATFDLAARRYDVISEKGREPAFLGGDRVLFLDDGKVFLADLRTKETSLSVAAETGSAITAFALSADRASLYTIRTRTDADVWLSERAPDGSRREKR